MKRTYVSLTEAQIAYIRGLVRDHYMTLESDGTADLDLAFAAEVFFVLSRAIQSDARLFNPMEK